MKTRPVSLSLITVVVLVLGACAGTPTPSATPTAVPTNPTAPTATAMPTPSPTSTPTAQAPQPTAVEAAAKPDISQAALDELARIVESYVEDDRVVGAQLLVSKDRQILLQKAYGWRDREAGLPMTDDTLCNIRSMTKPVMGTAIQMLMDEGILALDDRVADYLPSFDNDRSRDITVEHLLTHRSGLPMTMIATSFGEYDSLRKLADGAGEQGPEYPPGSGFHYSDAGSEVLAALVEVASGKPFEQFVQQRVLNPLSMSDTVMLVEESDERTQRIAGLYYGSEGAWSRIWSATEDDPLYPYAMGSQSLYTTPEDYARFLSLWMDEGMLGDERLLSHETVDRALTPISDGGLPGGFPGLRLDYAQMWIIYVPDDSAVGDGPMKLFGHSGSDGTWAWAWPDLDLVVLYFTQSRGQGTGIQLEDEIDRLLIHPGRETLTLPEEYERYLGTYTALSGPLMLREFEVLDRGGKLAVNLSSDILSDLEGPDAKGWWQLKIDPSISLSFAGSEEGQADTMLFRQSGQVFELPRGAAPEEAPLDMETVQAYLGFYERPEEPESGPVELIIHNDHLAVTMPEVMVPIELFPPDDEGRWALRLNPQVKISFQVDEEGRAISFTAHTPDGDYVRPKVD